jgi:hypothetical protein
MFDVDSYLLCLACHLVGSSSLLEYLTVRAEDDDAIDSSTTTAASISKAATSFYWETPVLLRTATPTAAFEGLPDTNGEGGKGGGGKGGGGEDTIPGAAAPNANGAALDVVLLNVSFHIDLTPPSSLSTETAMTAAAIEEGEEGTNVLIRAFYGCLLSDGTYWQQPNPLDLNKIRQQMETDLALDVDRSLPQRLAKSTSKALKDLGRCGGNDCDDDAPAALMRLFRDDDDNNATYFVKVPYAGMGSARIYVGRQPAPLWERMRTLDLLSRQQQQYQQQQQRQYQQKQQQSSSSSRTARTGVEEQAATKRGGIGAAGWRLAKEDPRSTKAADDDAAAAAASSSLSLSGRRDNDNDEGDGRIRRVLVAWTRALQRRHEREQQLQLLQKQQQKLAAAPSAVAAASPSHNGAPSSVLAAAASFRDRSGGGGGEQRAPPQPARQQQQQQQPQQHPRRQRKKPKLAG